MIKLNNLSIFKKTFAAIVLTAGLYSCNTTDESKTKEATDNEKTVVNEVKADQNKEKEESITTNTDSTSENSDQTNSSEIDVTEQDKTSENSKNLEIVVERDSEENIEEVTDKMTESMPEPGLEASLEMAEEAKVAEEVKEVVSFSHTIFDGLLRKYVTSSGKVNYNGFKSNRSTLQEYIALLGDNEPTSSWSSNKKLAYWINVYNANMIELMLKNNIPSSVMNINNGKAWDLKVVKIGSKTYSLNDVEHNIIRKQFNEPRIHFACVCAAKSCPKLLNKAYTESNLKSSLQAQAVYFINNSSKNQIENKNLKVSQLFNWYASDFGDINAYIRKYSKTEFKDDKDIEFQVYDWSINN